MEWAVIVLFAMCAILFVLSVWLLSRYKKLLAKHKIVVDELCEYLDDEVQEESEWGNKR